TGLDNIYAASKLHLGQALMKRLGLRKQEAVVIGDTDHDYEVAGAIGADCILIANGHQSKTRLQALGAPGLDDVKDLVAPKPTLSLPWELEPERSVSPDIS